MKELKLEALAYAKQAILEGRNLFICTALMDWADQHNEVAAMQELCGYIERALEGSPTLTNYLHEKYARHLRTEHVNMARMAWIDKMIYDLENEA